MKEILCTVVVVVALHLDVASGLVCKLCNGATTLQDCENVHCDDDLEACFMEEQVTDMLTIQYMAGCRSKEVCRQAFNSGLVVGRRDLMACSRCCYTDYCNKRMCGISEGSSTPVCLGCSELQGSMTSCSNYTHCENDEVCYASTTTIDSREIHQFGCYNKNVCRFLVRKMIEDFSRCEKQPSPQKCRKALESQKPCHICWGEDVYGYGYCSQIKELLYYMYQHHALDLTTLKQNGSLPGGSGDLL